MSCIRSTAVQHALDKDMKIIVLAGSQEQFGEFLIREQLMPHQARYIDRASVVQGYHPSGARVFVCGTAEMREDYGTICRLLASRGFPYHR